MGYRMDEHSDVMEAIETQAGRRLDASESTFVARELTRVRTTIYTHQFQPLKGRSLVPINTEMAPEDRFYEYYEITPVGVAEFITDYSADLPRVDLFLTIETARVRDLGDSYAWNFNEMAKAAKGKVQLQMQKPLLARSAVEQKIDRIIMLGDAAFNIKGLFNQTGTITYVIPNGASASPLWENKTPEEIFDDITGICNGIVTATKEVEQPDTILLPLSLYMHISKTRMWSNGSSEHTILQWIMKIASESQGTGIAGIKTIMAVAALEDAGVGGTRRIVVYRKDPSKLEFLEPRSFQQMPPEKQNLELVTNCVATVGGVVLYIPMSMSYADGA